MPVPRLLPEEGEPKVALFAAFWARPGCAFFWVDGRRDVPKLKPANWAAAGTRGGQCLQKLSL